MIKSYTLGSRTPLNGIIGGIALILKTTEGECRQRLLNIVHSCASQMLNLINDMLDLSKVRLKLVFLFIILN